MKLNIVPGIEKRSMYFRYFKIDSILELYAEQKIIIGKMRSVLGYIGIVVFLNLSESHIGGNI